MSSATDQSKGLFIPALVVCVLARLVSHVVCAWLSASRSVKRFSMCKGVEGGKVQHVKIYGIQGLVGILAEGAIVLPVTLSGGVLFAS